MGIIETKTFKSGNSSAVRLPKELGFAPGTSVTIERRGNAVTIKPKRDAAGEKRKVSEFVGALEEIWVGQVYPQSDPASERMTFPDRGDLY